MYDEVQPGSYLWMDAGARLLLAHLPICNIPVPAEPKLPLPLRRSASRSTHPQLHPLTHRPVVAHPLSRPPSLSVARACAAILYSLACAYHFCLWLTCSSSVRFRFFFFYMLFPASEPTRPQKRVDYSRNPDTRELFDPALFIAASVMSVAVAVASSEEQGPWVLDAGMKAIDFLSGPPHLAAIARGRSVRW